MAFGLHSIKWQLQFWHMLIICVLIVGFLMFFYNHERSSRLKALDDSLQLPMLRIAPHFFSTQRRNKALREKELGENGNKALTGEQPFTAERFFQFKPNGKGRNYAKTIALDTLKELQENGYYVKIWNSDGGVLYSTSESIPEITIKPELPSNMLKPVLKWENGNREVLLANTIGDTILIGYSANHFHKEMSGLRNQLIGIGLCGVVITGTLGWYFNSLALKPIKVMSDSARAISNGDLSHRVKIGNNRNELGDLADTLNETFDKLELSLKRQKQFVADASHELRTPLSILLNEIEWALEKQRSGDEYVASLSTGQTTAEHMKEMVDSLLDLAKLDSGKDIPDMKHLKLDEFVEDAVKLLQPMADLNEVKLDITADDVSVSIDPTKIKQVIVNLVSNAITHAPPQTSVRIKAYSEANHIFIKVSDQGPGIKDEKAPLIFDRFYRGSRSRAYGKGSGLGLAISQAVAVAHGGGVELTHSEGTGCEFTLKLPHDSQAPIGAV